MVRKKGGLVCVPRKDLLAIAKDLEDEKVDKTYQAKYIRSLARGVKRPRHKR